MECNLYIKIFALIGWWFTVYSFVRIVTYLIKLKKVQSAEKLYFQRIKELDNND